MLIDSIKPLAAITLLVAVAACTPAPKKPLTTAAPADAAYAFEPALQFLTANLLRQIENEQRAAKTLKEGKLLKTHITVAPFADMNTGEIIKTHTPDTDAAELRAVMLNAGKETVTCDTEECPQEGPCQPIDFFARQPATCPNGKPPQPRFPEFILSLLSQENLQAADYILYGMVAPSKQDAKTAADTPRHTTLYASVVDRHTRKIVAKASVATHTPLEIMPLAIFRERFLYLQDSELRFLSYKVKDVVVGSKIEDRDELDALLMGAATFYEKNDCEKAYALYRRAAETYVDSQTAGTYAALHKTGVCAGEEEAAGQAIEKALKLGVDEQELNTKITFEYASAEFPSHKADEYQAWLYHMGRIAEENQYCVELIGHASRTGSDEKFNQRLSQRRAREVQNEIWRNWRNVRSTAYGKGSSECIICATDKDDESNAVDRRVEIRFIECGGK